MNNNTIILGIIAVVALFFAGCVSQGAGSATATPEASAVPTAPAVTDVQVNAAIGDVDKAIADIDSVTSELSDINSQDMNASVVDATG